MNPNLWSFKFSFLGAILDRGKKKKKTKGSITIAKRKEDNGQPCLAPLCHFKKGEFKLLVCTDLVRILHNSFNPIFMKVFLKWRVWGFGGFVVVVGVRLVFFFFVFVLLLLFSFSFVWFDILFFFFGLMGLFWERSTSISILLNLKSFPVSWMDKPVLSNSHGK